MTKTTVEYILVTKQVFDPGGKWVCDLGGSSGRNVSGKQGIEKNYKSQILVVVTSYVQVEKSLLGSKEYEFGRGVEELAFLLEQVLEYSKGIRRPVRYEVRKESIEVENGLEEDVVVESVKDLVDEDNVLIDYEFSESNSNQDIRNIEVLKLECVEIVKSGLEKWTRNGVNNIEGQVIAGDLQKYEVGLISVKDALSS
nr:hypothetical protein [Tanacetum cinerariifolium]